MWCVLLFFIFYVCSACSVTKGKVRFINNVCTLWTRELLKHKVKYITKKEKKEEIQVDSPPVKQC